MVESRRVTTVKLEHEIRGVGVSDILQSVTLTSRVEDHAARADLRPKRFDRPRPHQNGNVVSVDMGCVAHAGLERREVTL